MKNKVKQIGFTLIELLVVLVLISLLAGLVGPKLFNQVGSSKTKVAGAQIELLTSALNTYRLDMGEYPSTEQGLNALMQNPSGSGMWNGPYLAKDLPMDPWNRPYHYELKPNYEFVLYTLGRDNKVGGEGEDQDVGNK
ncbi:TPA: type II secretion system major pseudopilin GspG [Vibrio vulnificus]|uniref:type II secretion system major pseudopilin GspG n=1 Tax=Vibrio vulnificus TaxID=672 RepID=UPI00092C6634|nr:type II secretion system major pseudopilin GspG [Vibrio vulnificus]EHT4940757.1 type II secretion system major pseudopilin GspG [Vibrio vulnificus]OJI25165.1 Type II secretion system protein G precursor [Vibrio vulnificus]OJI43192.1 Type II secretion system protein G precursor [Vibrio vulnificus]POB04927.1 type II secretion system protein GspG [Vibrio vulnificus]HAS6164990.1 type II secretion system major pseudopilin GspG [Vibrio vulnificus]